MAGTTLQFKQEWVFKRLISAKKQKLILSKKKFLAQMCFDCLTTKRTAQEVLDSFEANDKIKVVGDNILIKKI